MKNTQQIKSFPRRQFIKTGLLFGLQFLFGCTSSSAPKVLEGKPKHHTVDGFQNYPAVPPPSRLGFGFWWRRMKASFNKPEIPPGHYLSGKEAIALYNRIQERNTITWHSKKIC